MYELTDKLIRKLEVSDLVDVERELLPIEPNEHRIGVLDEEQRRWHALQVLEFRRRCRINREMGQCITEPLRLERMQHLFLESRDNRVRLHAYQGLFLISLNLQFPGILDRDVLLIREGWTVVWKKPTDVTRKDIEAGNVLADDLANDEPRTVH